MKRNCKKYKRWLVKKGTNSIFICFESNLADVPTDSWWFDTGASVHLTNSL